MLKVSVVVPVYNAMRTLPCCLSALTQLSPAPDEILLVDNSSTDGSFKYLQAFARDCAAGGVQVLREPRRGAAAARNAGIRVAKGEVVAFTDADCAPERAWLEQLAGPFEDPSVGAVAGRVVAATPSSTLELFSALYTLQLGDQPVRRKQWTPWEGGYPTANLAVRRGLLDDLGGFDESVRTGEDYDLCARLYARGCAVVYVPDARVAHHHRTSLGSMLRQAFGFGRGHPYLLRRHATRGLWLDLPWRSVAWSRWPLRAWVDLASADKKMVAILLLSTLYRPLLLLLPVYAGWLSAATSRRARKAGQGVTPLGAVELAGLLLLKSAAMTAGRWWGSIRYKGICL
jgi:GT2 family glycosyltransferase